MHSAIPYLVQALAICLLDFVTPREFTMWVLYLLPAALSTWNLGPRTGVLIGVAASLLNFATWLHHLAPKPGWHAVTVLSSHFFVFFLVIVLISKLRAKEVERVFHPMTKC